MKVKVSVLLPADLHYQLKLEAVDAGSIQAIVEGLVRRHVEERLSGNNQSVATETDTLFQGIREVLHDNVPAAVNNLRAAADASLALTRAKRRLC